MNMSLYSINAKYRPCYKHIISELVYCVIIAVHAKDLTHIYTSY